jgi:hypothetical protein
VSPPTHAATYERARRFANRAVWTAALQRRRLKSVEPEDGEFLSRRWSDFEFFVVSLTRLRRAAKLAATVPSITDAMTAALSEFDDALPMLKDVRDIAEHFDEYARDEGDLNRKAKAKGSELAVSRKGLEVGVVGDTTFQWLDHELNADLALSAARRLFKAIQSVQSAVRD